MSTDRQDGNIVKNLKEKIQGVTYPAKESDDTLITIRDTVYAVKLEDGMEVYPGSIIEHSPFVKKDAGQGATLCTKIIKVL